MSRKKITPQQVKEMIDTITKENKLEIKNKELDLSFQRLEQEEVKLEAFKKTLENRKREYSAINM